MQWQKCESAQKPKHNGASCFIIMASQPPSPMTPSTPRTPLRSAQKFACTFQTILIWWPIKSSLLTPSIHPFHSHFPFWSRLGSFSFGKSRLEAADQVSHKISQKDQRPFYDHWPLAIDDQYEPFEQLLILKSCLMLLNLTNLKSLTGDCNF